MQIRSYKKQLRFVADIKAIIIIVSIIILKSLASMVCSVPPLKAAPLRPGCILPREKH